MKKPSFESGYAQLGALKMYYEIHGKGGMPLVLLHGGGSTIKISFGRVLDSLAADRQVIAVELQAHGHTRDIGKPTSFKQDADDVAALLKYLNIPKADIFGFSNGGQTGMQIAISHPEIVNKLIIMGAFYQREGAFAGFFNGFAKATLNDMPEELRAANLREDPDPAHLQIMFERDRARMEAFKDWTDEEVHSIKAKTLIFSGDNDVVTREHAVKMSRIIPNAQLVIVPGTHGAYLGELGSGDGKMQTITVGLVKEFLDKLGGASISCAIPADIPALTRLVNSAYRGEGGWTHESHLLSGPRTNDTGIDELMRDPQSMILKYTDGQGVPGRDEQDVLVGCVYLQKQGSKLYLGLLSVSPEQQGKGVGQDLLNSALAYAREIGCASIRITVISVRHELIEWYERHGYKRTGETEPFHAGEKFGIQKQPLELVVLEKPVD